MINDDIWNDQREFNLQLRPSPQTYEERMQLTKEFMLHLMAECGSTLDASGAWKMHRNHKVPENRERIKAELIDVFKYWLSIVQAQGFTPGEMYDAYWLKSAAVRQHWAEEWVRDLDQPMVLIDLDNVLCDYVAGISDWLLSTIREGLFTYLSAATVHELRRTHALINAASLNISERQWREIKHRFRTNGAKRTLPAMPKAAEFVDWCRAQGWAVVILTSRPIDQYPNLYQDTVHWLMRNHIHADYVWWGTHKAEKIAEVMYSQDRVPNVVCAVDDDPQFIWQYRQARIRSYWLTRSVENGAVDEYTRAVTELDEIIRLEGAQPWVTMTQRTDRTPTIEANPPSTTSPSDQKVSR